MHRVLSSIENDDKPQADLFERGEHVAVVKAKVKTPPVSTTTKILNNSV